MANKPARMRPNGRRLSRGADYVALALIAIAAVALATLALSGVTLNSGAVIPRSSASIPTATLVPTQTPTPSARPQATVSLLGDRVSAAPGSWWKRLATSTLDGVTLAGSAVPVPVDGASNSTVAELQSEIDSTTIALSGYVIVQAGSADVDDGAASGTVAVTVQGLWKAVSIRGATPIVALLPPSDVNAEGVIAVNELLAAAALSEGYPVLDLHTAVAAANGTWSAGYSDDGIEANEEGSRVMVQAAITQLQELVGRK